MFSSSTFVTVAATQSSITRSRCGLPHDALVSVLPFGRTTLVMAIGFEYTPPAASVAYAEASSIGVTAIEPSAIDGTASRGSWSDVRTPSFCAIVTMFAGPTSSASRAYTVLSDCTVAFATDSTPAYVCSYVCTFQAQFGSDELHVASGW